MCNFGLISTMCYKSMRLISGEIALHLSGSSSITDTFQKIINWVTFEIISIN